MPQWVDIIVKITPAFVTLVVGTIAAYVAFLQYKINRDKFRAEMFDKRFEAFEKLQEYFAAVLANGGVNDQMLATLLQAKSMCRFLYEQEVHALIDKTWERAVRLRNLDTKLHGPASLPVGPERAAAAEEEGELVKWHIDQMRSFDEIFAPYLGFGR